MFSKKIFLYNFVILSFRVHADGSKDGGNDMVQKFVEMLLECGKDFPITGNDIEQLQNRILPDNENMRCLFACAYKASGMMDNQGKLSVEGVNNRAQEYLADDPEKLARARDFTDACKNVNDIEVSDGEKGCDRAALIFKCGVEKAAEFGFGP